MGVQESLDLTSVFFFSLTGALVASRKQLDIVGFMFVSALTSVGGGTLRDLFMGRTPVFWMREPTFIGVATFAAVLVFFSAHLLESRYKAMVWLDAIALSIAVPAGVNIAMLEGFGWPVALMTGVATGCFGGLMRDVVCNEVPLALRQGEAFVTCALIGAATGIFVHWMGASMQVTLLTTGGVTFATRAGALCFGWRIPVYKSRPPRVNGGK